MNFFCHRGLHAALAERDRNLNHMREQMKYYIAFAENSIEGHLESGPRKPVGDQEQIRDLISKLQSAKVCINVSILRIMRFRSKCQLNKFYYY